MSSRGPPQMPAEEPVIPLTQEQAKARHTLVKRNVDLILRLRQEGKSAEEIQEALPQFAQNFPFFFKKLTGDEAYNESSLRTVMTMLERMGAGQLSQDQASQIVGQRMVDTYIKPKLQGNGGGAS